MLRLTNIFIASLLLGSIGATASAQTGTAMDGGTDRKTQNRPADSSRSLNGEKSDGSTRGVTSGGSGNDENAASRSTTGNASAATTHQQKGTTSDQATHRNGKNAASNKAQSKENSAGAASISTTGTTSVPGSSIPGDGKK